MTSELEIEKRVIATIRNSLPKSNQKCNIDKDSNLKDLGLDSLGFMELLLSLEDSFKMSLSEDVSLLEKIHTPKDLIYLISKQIK